MTDPTDTDPDNAADTTASPAAAFEALRHELSLLHNAVAGLTAAREKIPDYRPDLDALRDLIGDSRNRLAALGQSPALRLTPAALTSEIVTAAKAAREEDQRLLEAARVSMHQCVGAISSIVRRGQAADRQTVQLVQAALTGLLAGILLWSFLPGVIARALPASWHVPEWMAERTMGTVMPVTLPSLAPAPPNKASETHSGHRKGKSKD